MSQTRRSQVIVLNDHKVALIHRLKFGQEYLSLPGGHIEIGEDPLAAAIREIKEELGFDISNLVELKKVDTPKFFGVFFKAITDQFEFKVIGPEKSRLHNRDNLFDPQWYPLNELPDLPIFPTGARELIESITD